MYMIDVLGLRIYDARTCDLVLFVNQASLVLTTCPQLSCVGRFTSHSIAISSRTTRCLQQQHKCGWGNKSSLHSIKHVRRGAEKADART
jgi:hypothetical protein